MKKRGKITLAGAFEHDGKRGLNTKVREVYAEEGGNLSRRSVLTLRREMFKHYGERCFCRSGGKSLAGVFEHPGERGFNTVAREVYEEGGGNISRWSV